MRRCLFLIGCFTSIVNNMLIIIVNNSQNILIVILHTPFLPYPPFHKSIPFLISLIRSLVPCFPLYSPPSFFIYLPPTLKEASLPEWRYFSGTRTEGWCKDTVTILMCERLGEAVILRILFVS